MATTVTNNSIVNANEFDWTDLTSWSTYTNWQGFGVSGVSTTLEYTTASVDLGAARAVLPVLTVFSNGTNAFQFQTSPDDTTWTNATAPLEARYVRLIITVTGPVDDVPQLFSYLLDYQDTNLQREYISNLDTSTLSGTVAAREIPIDKTYSKIVHIRGVASTGETKVINVVPVSKNETTPTIRCIDLDTYGKTNTDATIDLEVVGMGGITTTNNGTTPT